MNDQMKFFYLYLASILIHPCPYCWVGEAVFKYLDKPVIASVCCDEDCSCPSDTHSHGSQHHKNHDNKQKCPCQCHTKETIYAQLVPSIDLRGVASELTVSFDESCCFFENITITANEIDSTSILLTVSLRI